MSFSGLGLRGPGTGFERFGGTWRRLVLMPLVPLYAAVLRIEKAISGGGRWKKKQLRNPVISVGSVSAGGAGKTPMVLLLAEMLTRRGYAVRILTRGYGRRSGAVERVELDAGLGGSLGGDTERYGDEPVLLAQRSRVPVYVGTDRYRAGLMAEEVPAGKAEEVTPGKAENLPVGKIVVHLLDDGFQHRGLARDIDVVLLTRKDVEDVLLPAGDLREPLTALREADVIVLREDEVVALSDFVAGMMRETRDVPLWVVRRRLRVATEGPVPRPGRPLAFCGIARPEGFFEMLEADGCGMAGRVVFGDHYAYGERDVTRLIEEALRCGADGFITTEKDAVKLTRPMRDRMEGVGTLAIAELQVELLNEKTAMEQMISMVERMDRRRT